jgi:hypothetical protein
MNIQTLKIHLFLGCWNVKLAAQQPSSLNLPTDVRKSEMAQNASKLFYDRNTSYNNMKWTFKP